MQAVPQQQQRNTSYRPSTWQISKRGLSPFLSGLPQMKCCLKYLHEHERDIRQLILHVILSADGAEWKVWT